MLTISLTLTLVVFEFCNGCVGTFINLRLTLTLVVFEFLAEFSPVYGSNV